MISIIGIGSPIGDDQIAWHIIDALPKKKSFEFYKLNRPGLDLIHYFYNKKKVVLIDAIIGKGRIGDIFHFDCRTLCYSKETISTHDISVFEAIQLADAIHVLPRKITLYGIEIDPLNKGNCLSDSLKPLIKKFAHRIQNDLYQ